MPSVSYMYYNTTLWVHYKDPHVSAIGPAPEHVIWIGTIKSLKLVFTLLNSRQYGTQD
jgi:hypothetical protein